MTYRSLYAISSTKRNVVIHKNKHDIPDPTNVIVLERLPEANALF